MDPSQIDPNQNIMPYEKIAEMRKAAKLAEALRSQAALSARAKDQPNVSVTASNANFPGQVDMNRAGIYANLTRDLVSAGLNAWGAHKDLQGEDARSAAMQEMMNQVGAPGQDGKPSQMTAQQAMILSDLGIHPSVVKQAMQDDSFNIMKNLHSYAKNPAAINALVQMGQLPPEVGEQMMADLETMRESELADKAALYEFQAGLRPPPQNNMSEIELYMQNPELWRQMQTDKAKFGTGANGRGGAEVQAMNRYFEENPGATVEDFYRLKSTKGFDAPAMSEYDKKEYAKVNEKLEAAQQKLSNSQYILTELEKAPGEYFGNRAKMSNYAKTHEGALGQFLNAAARATASGTMISIDSKIMRSVLEDMKMLGGNDSNQELETILRSYIDSRNDPQAAYRFMQETERLAEEGAIAYEKELEELVNIDKETGRPIRYTGKRTTNYKKWAKEERARRHAAREAEKKKASESPAPQQTAPVVGDDINALLEKYK